MSPTAIRRERVVTAAEVEALERRLGAPVPPELGGQVHCQPFAAPGVGWIAVVADPDGAHFYLIELGNL
jgi:predicted enzyme related to lactoylglutathione lyase